MRREINTGDIKIEQKPEIVDQALQRGDMVQADSDLMKSLKPLSDPSAEEKKNLAEALDRADLVQVDAATMDKLARDLKFMEEPVTIRIEGSSDKNAPDSYPVWVNGKGAEVWSERLNRWVVWTYLPVRQVLTVKRKYVEVMLHAKMDNVETDYDREFRDPSSPYLRNSIKRRTNAFASFTIIKDDNPMGNAWVQEMMRRNY